MDATVKAALRRRVLPNWRAIAKRAWSLRLIEAAALADVVLNVVPFVSDFLPWWLTVALLACAWIGRLLNQPSGKPDNQKIKEALDAN